MTGKPPDTLEPQFRGLFVPASVFELLDNRTINPLELLLLMTIDRYTSPDPGGLGCWASYEYLGEHVRQSEIQVRKMVSRLLKLGLLRKAGTLLVGKEKRQILTTEYPSNY